MPVQADQKDFFNFVAGLNSEAGWFTAPPNTWSNGDNVTPSIDGTLRKRVALDYESLVEVQTVASAGTTQDQLWAYSTNYWNSVGGDGDLNIIVVQIGRYLHFYENISGAVTGRKYSFTVDLNTYKAPTNPATIGTSTVQTVSATGKLVVVSADTEPLLITYNSSTSITVTPIVLYMRDFVGVNDGYAIDFRPDAVPNTDAEWKHEYNLRNQGWNTSTLATYRATGFSPSNAQSWIYGKDSSDVFQAALLDKQDFGTSPAPKGRFLLNAFSRDRATASGVSSTYVPTENEGYRPRTCAFFAGRAWFSGIKGSTLLSNYIFFSQVASSDDKFGKCYQDLDPTSEILNDILDSDGGHISIQDCGEIMHLEPTVNGILVFASNGVWKIAGTANTGFTAAGYEVTKVSSIGTVSDRSVVVTDVGIFYWGQAGIYIIAPTENGVTISVTNVSDTIIKTFYNNISSLSKKYCEGNYNSAEKLVTWFYADNNLIENSGVSYRYRKNLVLTFDMRLKCFYTYSISSLATNSPYVVSLFTTKEVGNLTQTFNVTNETGVDNVVDALGNQVTITANVPNAGAAATKHLVTRVVSNQLYYAFADFYTTENSPDKFYDWHSVDGVGAEFRSSVETSYIPHATGFAKRGQSAYVTVFMERTETDIDANGDAVNASSCMLRAKWDFTDSTAANKWSAEQEVYRLPRLFLDDGSDIFDNGYPLVVTKNKVRGRGRALQLKFSDSAGKDMRLAGWSVQTIGNTNV